MQRIDIERLNRTGGLQLAQQFADAAMGPAQHRARAGQRFDHGPAECLGFARELQHQVAGGIGAGNRVCGSGERERVGDAKGVGVRFQLGDVGFASGFACAGQPQARVESIAAQPRQQRQRIGMAFQPRAAAGQQQQRAVAAERRMLRGRPRACFAVGPRRRRECVGIDPARNHPQSAGSGGGVMAQDIPAYRVRHADDAFAARHHRAVARRRVEAMDGGDQPWALGILHSTQRKHAHPRWQPRARMDDVDPFAPQ